jgi:alpha-mannosidase/mannosylglycerate hydrolase
MANEFIAVAFEANGTLTLTDQRTGEVYSRLLTFEDGADLGDGWYYGPTVNDQVFLSTTARSELALVCDGPLLTRFRLRTTLRLPAEFSFDRMVRAAEFADCIIESLVTLRAGCDRVEVRITVHNQVRDHRLRVLFPSGAQATAYLADSAFDVVERPIALPVDSHLHRELPVDTGPQQSWTAVHDTRRGLAVVAPGILESAVRDLPDRPLALTLLRATRRTIMSDGQPDGQVQGELTFDCWISPLAGAPDRTRLLEQGSQLGAGLRTAQLTRYDAKVTRCRGEVGPRGSLLLVEGDVVVTSVREVDGATEVRLFNPGLEPVKAALGFDGRPGRLPIPRSARMVNLESRPLGRPVAIRRGRLEFQVAPKQIVTWRLRS